MKTKLLLIPILFLFLFSCAKPDWKSPATYAENTLINNTVTAVAKHYGGEKAGSLASAGLSATAEVLQGYVDKKPPLDIIVQSPGVKGMGRILVDYLKDKGIVTQSTVDSIHKAAAFAADVTTP